MDIFTVTLLLNEKILPLITVIIICGLRIALAIELLIKIWIHRIRQIRRVREALISN